MATNYPGSIDSLTNPSAGDALTSPSHSAQHANANDAIEAIETELGVNPSGSDATVAARLSAIEAGTNLATGAVTSAKIADGTIATGDIADGAVTSQKLGSDLTVSGAFTVQAPATGFLHVNGNTAAGSAGSYMSFRDNGTPRWWVGRVGGAQTFVIQRCDSGGSVIDNSIEIDPATGRVIIGAVGAGAGLRMGATGASHMSGTGSPEGVVTAAPGSTWLQTDATTDVKGWIRWVKATGTGNTGWVAGAEADTGERNINALVTWPSESGDAFGMARVRRVGNMVHVYLRGAIGGTTGATVSSVLTLPTGFRPSTLDDSDGALVWHATRASAGDTDARFILQPDSGVVRVKRIAADASWFGGAVAYMTGDAWPSSLPGSAA